MGSICKINAVKMNELITFWQIFLRKEKRWTSYNLQCFLISVFKHLKFNVLKLNQNYWSCLTLNQDFYCLCSLHVSLWLTFQMCLKLSRQRQLMFVMCQKNDRRYICNVAVSLENASWEISLRLEFFKQGMMTWVEALGSIWVLT